MMRSMLDRSSACSSFVRASYRVLCGHTTRYCYGFCGCLSAACDPVASRSIGSTGRQDCREVPSAVAPAPTADLARPSRFAGWFHARRLDTSVSIRLASHTTAIPTATPHPHLGDPRHHHRLDGPAMRHERNDGRRRARQSGRAAHVKYPTSRHRRDDRKGVGRQRLARQRNDGGADQAANRRPCELIARGILACIQLALHYRDSGNRTPKSLLQAEGFRRQVGHNGGAGGHEALSQPAHHFCGRREVRVPSRQSRGPVCRWRGVVQWVDLRNKLRSSKLLQSIKRFADRRGNHDTGITSLDRWRNPIYFRRGTLWQRRPILRAT